MNWFHRKFSSSGPLIVYHATVAGRAILTEGFKTSSELEDTAALGGSNFRGSISFTTDYYVALSIYKGLVIMHSFANSPDPLALAREYITHLPTGTLNKMQAAYGGRSFEYQLNGKTIGSWRDDKPLTGEELISRNFEPLPDESDKDRYYYWLRPMTSKEIDDFTYQFVKYYLFFHPDLYDPLFFGSSVDNFRQIDRQDIGILTVELLIDPSKRRDRGLKEKGFDYLVGMGEIQVTDKSMISRILDFDNNPGSEPRIQANPIAYHVDPEVEDRLNKILPVLYKYYESLKSIFADPSSVIMLLRESKDIYRLSEVVTEIKKKLDWIMFSDAARVRRYFEMDDETKAGFDAQSPEIQKLIWNAKDDDETEDIIWGLMDSDDKYELFYDRLQGAGLRNPDEWRNMIVDWKRKQMAYQPRYKEELKSAQKFAPHVNDDNILDLDDVGRTLSQIFPSTRYAESVKRNNKMTDLFSSAKNWLQKISTSKVASVSFYPEDAFKISQPKNINRIGLEMDNWAVTHLPRNLLMSPRPYNSVMSDGNYIEEEDYLGIINWYVPSGVDPNELTMYIDQCIREELLPLGIKTKIELDKSQMTGGDVWRIQVVENGTTEFMQIPEVRTSIGAVILALLGLSEIESVESIFGNLMVPTDATGSIGAQDLLNRVERAYSKVKAFTMSPQKVENVQYSGISEERIIRTLNGLKNLAQFVITNNMRNVHWS